QWEDKGVRFDQGDLLISSVKAKELLFDPNRAKRYMIRVDRTETVITAATGIWYNLNYADRVPSVIAFWGVPMFPTEGPPSYVEEEGRWLRRGSIDIGLATTYGHTDTHVSGNVANSNTTGIDKAYAEIDLTWWGFPFFGEVFGTDLGAMVAYRNNVYDHNTDVKGNLAPTNLIRPNISWLWTNLMYRFAWGPYYDSPQAWAKVGYVFYDFDVATSPLVVVDKTFNGAYVGGRFLFPLNGLLNNLNMYVDAGAAMGDYKERGRSSVSPVTPKKYATLFRGETALSYYWTEWFSTDAQFWVDSLFMNFNPSGDVIETYWGFAGLRLQFRI
ncbi:MAG TPA: hypothetical protein VJL87_05670, partial [Bdellovibrionota bacterium]|nr:hypothetical protein [Bdellovibrionota bacterium]